MKKVMTKEVFEYEECSLCRGTGMFEDDEGYPDTCPECNGKGRVPIIQKASSILLS